jgi:hypothetical protein
VAHRIYLETAKRSVFAVSLDWPGWCRRGRDADDALKQFRKYESRYALIVSSDVATDAVEIVGDVAGTPITDFGAPRALGPWDDHPVASDVRLNHLDVLRECWAYFDTVVGAAPERLTKGPRGGGRDRDDIADHVREAERAFASKIGLRIAPRTPWERQRSLLGERLASEFASEKWPADFAIRIIAWHVVDHAWEIQDKTP